MSGDSRARVEQVLIGAFERREAVTALDCEVVTRDGRTRIFEINGVPVFNQQRDFCGYRGIARDVTGRKQSERELRESEEKFRVWLNRCRWEF
jgi:PAS domain S-box-containing protein